MNKKLIISYIVAFAILGIGIMIFKSISQKPQKKVTPIKKEIAGVFTEKITNSIKPLSVNANGVLVAKNKIDISSEVQGIFESSDHLFKPGIYFKKGEALLRLNSDEFKANLKIQKSGLYQKLVALLPDLRLDYPQQFNKWQQYVTDFSLERSVKPLPNFDTEKEKLFITGKGIITSYYQVKNLQERLGKYNIYAPFSGVLSTANVNIGSLISPGQQVGTFINPNTYELEVSVNASNAKIIKKGNSLNLYSIDKKKQWVGKIIRINPILDAQTQSMVFYVQVSGKGLSEGMYLEAEIDSKSDTPSYEINRSLLVNNKSVYVVAQDSILKTIDVNIIHVGEKTAFITGLEDDTRILNKPLPGAFDGKIVNIINHQD